MFSSVIAENNLLKQKIAELEQKIEMLIQRLRATDTILEKEKEWQQYLLFF